MIDPPRQLVLETSSACQLHCPQCWIGLHRTDRKGFLSMALFERIADEAQSFIKHCYLHLWGEPTLNKNLPKMIKRVKQFATIDLATHGLSLTEEMANAIALCDTVSVSIDGTDQATYEKYRVGGNLYEAMTSLTDLADKCRPGTLRWVFVVFKDNEHQIEEARAIAKDLEIPIEFKGGVFWDRSKMTAGMPSGEQFRRYRQVNGGWELKADRFKCREFWETMYVLPNGNVPTCCYDGAAETIVGNVWMESMLDIWNGRLYTEMRDRHSARQLNSLCEKHCQLMPN